MEAITARPRTAPHVANRPPVSLAVFVAAALGAYVWPRVIAPGAEVLSLLGAAAALVWAPFAIAACAEGVLAIAPHVGLLSDGPARRSATAFLVRGLRFLARASVWLIPLVAWLGPDMAAWPDEVTGSFLNSAIVAATAASLVSALPPVARVLGGWELTKAREVALRRRGVPDTPPRDTAASGSAVPGVLPEHQIAPAMGIPEVIVRRLLRAVHWLAGHATWWSRVVVSVAARWTLFGVVAVAPRLASDARVTLDRAVARSRPGRESNRAVASPEAGAATDAPSERAAAGSFVGRAVTFLRAWSAGASDTPVIYGPASIWTEELAVPVSQAAASARRPKTSLVTRGLELRPHHWRNDPAAGELCEIGNALLVAAHTDAILHGNSRGARAGAGMPPDVDEAQMELLGLPPEPPVEVGKRLILVRAWARPTYFAFILSAAPVVSNDVLGRLATANLAANVAANSRFTRSQVLAWLHTEHDPNDARAEVLVDDPARRGVVGTYVVFDRGIARRPPSSGLGTDGASGIGDQDTADTPFAGAPW